MSGPTRCRIEIEPYPTKPPGVSRGKTGWFKPKKQESTEDGIIGLKEEGAGWKEGAEEWKERAEGWKNGGEGRTRGTHGC